MDSKAAWLTVAKAGDLAPGAMKAVEAGDRALALYNIEGIFYATDNECTHAYAMLTDGAIDGDVIECPLHGGAFEIKTGKGLGAPIFCDLKTYPTRVQFGDVQVQVEA
jgi:nitrite reductase/ring-hydroxylating ferredoxin subunit